MENFPAHVKLKCLVTSKIERKLILSILFFTIILLVIIHHLKRSAIICPQIFISFVSISVIVLAVRGETLRTLMIHAYNLGLIEQNYMFICVYYYSQRNTFGDISWKQVPLFYRKVQPVSNRMVALQLQCIF